MIEWLREDRQEELDAIQRAQGFAYELPKLSGRNMVVRLGLLDEERRVRMAILGRRTVEAYFLIDHDWLTPDGRYAAFLDLHNAACESGARLGFEDVQAFLPPAVERAFGRRLRTLDWKEYVGEEWRCFSRGL